MQNAKIKMQSYRAKVKDGRKAQVFLDFAF
jgi:hypothetical protein